MRSIGLAALTLLLPFVAYAALININTADAELLDTLPGIGPSKAAAIIDYRTEHGPFARIEDIQNVSGIGPSTFADIQPFITVGDEDSSPPPPIASSTPPSELVTATSTPMYVPPPSTLILKLFGSHLAIRNAPLRLTARVTTKSGEPDSAAHITWSFGDGSSQTGTEVEKVYQHAGTYLVTVRAIDGAAVTNEDFIVTVQTAQVRVSIASQEGITISNDANERLDLSGWRLLSDFSSFRIPDGTTLLPKASVLFPSAITNLLATQDVSLTYPNGIVAARSMNVSETVLSPEVPQASPLQLSLPEASSYTIQAARLGETSARQVGPITSATPNSQTYDEAVVAPAASSNLAAAGAVLASTTEVASSIPPKRSSNGFFRSAWVAGLLGVLLVAGGMFVLL